MYLCRVPPKCYVAKMRIGVRLATIKNRLVGVAALLFMLIGWRRAIRRVVTLPSMYCRPLAVPTFVIFALIARCRQTRVSVS